MAMVWRPYTSGVLYIWLLNGTCVRSTGIAREPRVWAQTNQAGTMSYMSLHETGVVPISHLLHTKICDSPSGSGPTRIARDHTLCWNTPRGYMLRIFPN